MSNATRLFVLAGAALSFSSAVLAAEPVVDTDQVRATVREMLADAETRSSLLEGGGTAGHNGRNFYLASGDGNFVMNFFAYTQLRYMVHFSDNTNPGGTPSTPSGDSFDSGFTNNLTVVGIFGNFLSPAWEYVVSVQMSDNSGSNVAPVTPGGAPTTTGGGGAFLYDGYISYKFDQNAKFQMGQYKSHFMREASLGDTTLMAANRSVLESAFGQGRSQGVSAIWTSDAFFAALDFNDGFRTANTNWNSTAESDYNVGGRFNWRFAGSDDQLRDYTSMPGDPFGGCVGGAVAYAQGLNDPASVIGVPPVSTKYGYLTYTVDAQVEGGGFGAYAAFTGANTDQRDPAGNNLNNYGGALQGNWRFHKDWEVFCRGDWIQMDSAQVNIAPVTGQRRDMFFVTPGINYYIAGQAAKVTLDCIIALQPSAVLATTSIVPGGSAGAGIPGNGSILNANNGIGLLGSTQGGETAVRLQFQAAF
ncbi:MAG: hypothetical protein ACREJO_07795 [Phycisphaerales bacterium]